MLSEGKPSRNGREQQGVEGDCAEEQVPPSRSGQTAPGRTAGPGGTAAPWPPRRAGSRPGGRAHQVPSQAQGRGLLGAAPHSHPLSPCPGRIWTNKRERTQGSAEQGLGSSPEGFWVEHGNKAIRERDGVFTGPDTTHRGSPPTRQGSKVPAVPRSRAGPQRDGTGRARRAPHASHHFHPGAADRNEPSLCHVVLNLGVEPRVPAPHPLELLRLPEHRGQSQLPLRLRTGCCRSPRLLSGVTLQKQHAASRRKAPQRAWQQPLTLTQTFRRERTHLGADEGELGVALHQADNRDPAPSTLADGLLVRPQPGCRDRHNPSAVIAWHKYPPKGSSGNGAVLPFKDQAGKC